MPVLDIAALLCWLALFLSRLEKHAFMLDLLSFLPTTSKNFQHMSNVSTSSWRKSLLLPAVCCCPYCEKEEHEIRSCDEAKAVWTSSGWSSQSGKQSLEMGFEKEIIQEGQGPTVSAGAFVKVKCKGYGKNGNINEQFWSTEDPGQTSFKFQIGQGKVTPSVSFAYPILLNALQRTSSNRLGY